MTDDTAAVFYNDGMLEHRPSDGEFELEATGRLAGTEPHPDRPLRVENVRSILRHCLSDHLRWKGVDPAKRKPIERVHEADYVDEIRDIAAAGGGRITPETALSEGTWRAARLAVGAAIAATEDVLSAAGDGVDVAYALARPSGHHAGPRRADGFCFFNNAAIGAETALERSGINRVAILDWDVHHGNGTQEAFYDREDVLVVSLHNDHPSWNPEAHPQTGDLDEDGANAGTGYTVNMPLPPGTGDRGYGLAFDRLVEPIVRSYGPDLLVVSAGQDPGVVDPLGRNVVTMEGFRELGARVRRLAEETPAGGLALVQEGGYQVSHLAYATLAVVEGVLGTETGIEDPYAWLKEDVSSARTAVDRAVEHHARHWSSLDTTT